MALGKCIKELTCELTDDERNVRAGELALAIVDHDTLEEEKKAFAANWKERKTALDLRIHRLADARNFGTESREVECVETWNAQTRKVEVYRSDTDAYVLSRDLQDDEKQTDFEDSRFHGRN